MKATFVAAEDALGEALAKIAEGIADARRATHVREDALGERRPGHSRLVYDKATRAIVKVTSNAEDNTVVAPYATWQEAYNDALLVTAKQSVEIASQRVEIARLAVGEGADENEAWLIVYDDKDMLQEMFASHGATEAAHRRFEQMNSAWNCHLFHRVRKPNERGLDRRDAEIAALREELSIWKSVFPDIAPESVLPDRSKLEAEIVTLRAALSDDGLGERGLPGAVMDVLWPEFGGDHRDVDFWNEASLIVHMTIRHIRDRAAIKQRQEKTAQPGG